MKNRKSKNFFKKRTFIYFSGRILIKSDVNLTKQQRIEIYKIIRTTMQNPYYGCESQITRTIFHKLKTTVSSVEFHPSIIGFIVKIVNKN